MDAVEPKEPRPGVARRYSGWLIVAGLVLAGIAIGLAPFLGPVEVGFFVVLSLVLLFPRPTRKLAVIALGVFCFLGVVCVVLCLDSPDPGRALECAGNLGQIAKALRCYEAVYKKLPPAYIADAEGKPMHSWRVLVLPFMDEEELYKRYSFQEPWDGPNNRKLEREIGRIYTCPSDQSGNRSRTMTNYVLVTGPSTLFPRDQSIDSQDLPGGGAETILVVEVADSGIHCMEPRELSIEEMDFKINGQLGKSVSSMHGAGWFRSRGRWANVAFAGGQVERLPADLPPEELKKMLTIGADTKKD